MQSQVIVPLDGSTNAEAILPHALFFAQQAQSLLTLLRVIMPPGEPEYTVPSIPDDWYTGEVMWTKNYLTSLTHVYRRKEPVCKHSTWREHFVVPPLTRMRRNTLTCS